MSECLTGLYTGVLCNTGTCVEMGEKHFISGEAFPTLVTLELVVTAGVRGFMFQHLHQSWEWLETEGTLKLTVILMVNFVFC